MLSASPEYCSAETLGAVRADVCRDLSESWRNSLTEQNRITAEASNDVRQEITKHTRATMRHVSCGRIASVRLSGALAVAASAAHR